jgi:hypothetical protein
VLDRLISHGADIFASMSTPSPNVNVRVLSRRVDSAQILLSVPGANILVLPDGIGIVLLIMS